MSSTLTDKGSSSNKKSFFKKPKMNRKVSFSSFVVTPFAMGTLIFAAISWIVAFAGSIASATSGSGLSFPKFTWWGLVFELLLFSAILMLYATNGFHEHKLFLVASIAVAFVYTTNSTTSLIYSKFAARQAAAAGCLLLSIINLLWLFYFGSEPSSPVIQWIDGGRVAERPVSRYRDEEMAMRNNSMRSMPTVQAPNPFEAMTPELQQQEGEYGVPIKGFENASASHLGDHLEGEGTVLPDDDYPYLVRGLYDYVANPDDLNELSFKKGEVFKVKDTNGKWWQGKNANGDIGMCPSNYIELLS